MATILFANNATTTLAGPLTQTATTANVAAGTGVLFPQPGNGQLFKLTLTDAATSLLNEIVHVTAVNGDAFTIARGQENTSPQSWLAGDLADNLNTAGTMQAFAQTASITAGAYQGTDSGTSPDSMVVSSTTPALSAPVQGQYFEIVKSGQGNTGPVTLTVGSGGSAVSVVYKDGTALGPGDYPANAAAILYYTGGVFQFMACQSAPAVRVYAGVDSGSADAMAVTPSPPVPAYVDNLEVHFVKAASTNATTAPTLKLGSLTAQTVFRKDGTALVAGDLQASSLTMVKYDTALGGFRLTTSAPSQIVGQAAAQPNPNNTQISTNSNAALSLQQGTQAIPTNQLTKILWNTDVVPNTIGTYTNGDFTTVKPGWYEIAAAIVLTAVTPHTTVTDAFSVTTSVMQNSNQAAVDIRDVLFKPQGTPNFGQAIMQAQTNTPAIYLAAGDKVNVTVVATNSYNDATNIVAQQQCNLKIQFLNP